MCIGSQMFPKRRNVKKDYSKEEMKDMATDFLKQYYTFIKRFVCLCVCVCVCFVCVCGLCVCVLCVCVCGFFCVCVCGWVWVCICIHICFMDYPQIKTNSTFNAD